MSQVALVVSILCLAALFHTYVGYPLLMAALARVRPRPIRKAPNELRCSILISACNEEERLPEKIRQLRTLPGFDRVDAILVGSDGSTDGTAAALRELGEPKLQVEEYPSRRGKPSVLNDLMQQAKCEIVVFTDARQILGREALPALLENFSDPEVGVVSGELIFRSGDESGAAAGGVRSYWSYEKWIRKNESASGSVPGATGALYAMRRELVSPLDGTTLLDDVALPMRGIRRGFRCVFEGRAVAFDRVPVSEREEGIRKRRTLAGNLQLLLLDPWLLNPLLNPIWGRFLSHKIMRLIAPWALVGLLVGSCLARHYPLMDLVLCGQTAVYSAGLVGFLLRRLGIRPGPFGAAWMFLLVHLMAARAWMDLAAGRFDARWERSLGTR